jgi:hypothetical protein
LAFAAYLIISIALFGRGALPHLDSVCACAGDGDPTSFMWSFEWWPHAILNGLNPFHPDVIWSPEGANLAQTGVALPAATLLMAPVTLIAGPMVSYNIVSLLLPVLAAWFTFLLCRRLTGSFGPSFVGGLIFGFGTYMSAHLLGHLNLSSVFLAPAAVLLVLQRLDDAISRRRFVVLMALVFAAQLLLSAELLIIGIGVGAFALLVARVRWTVVKELLGAGGLAMMVTSPFLYWAVKGVGDADREAWKQFTELYPGDALNPLLPTQVTWIGHSWFEDTTAKFTNFTPSEAASYVGPVLLAILIWFAVTQWRRRATKVLVAVIAVCYLLYLGTELHVAGDDTGVWMPWSLLHPLPLLDHVISTRFWAYALLGIAIAVALWLAEPGPRAGLRWALAGVGVLLMLPNLSSDFWDGRPTDPAFFRTDAYKRELDKGELVLALPYARYGSSMLWQARTGMYFDMPEGYISPEFPPGFRDDPFFPTLISGRVGKQSPDAMRDFLERRKVDAVVLDAAKPGGWPLVLNALGFQPVKSGGVLFYRVS